KNDDGSGSLITISPAAAPTCINQMHAVEGQALAIVASTFPNVTVDIPAPPNDAGTTARSRPAECRPSRLATGISADSSCAAAVVANPAASSLAVSSQCWSHGEGVYGASGRKGVNVTVPPPIAR